MSDGVFWSSYAPNGDPMAWWGRYPHPRVTACGEGAHDLYGDESSHRCARCGWSNDPLPTKEAPQDEPF